MSSNMRLMADFLFPLVVGSIALSEYTRLDGTTLNNVDNYSFLLGGGILLILEAVVALLCMMYPFVLEMTDSFRNALFRAHEIFALFFILGIYGSVHYSISSPEILFVALFILFLFVIYNAIQIYDDETEYVGSEENQMMLSRLFVSVAGLLNSINVFQNLNKSEGFPFEDGEIILMLITFTFGLHFVLGYFMNSNFNMQVQYLILATIGTILSISSMYSMVHSVNGALPTDEEDHINIASIVMAGLGVALAHFKGGEGGGFSAL